MLLVGAGATVEIASRAEEGLGNIDRRRLSNVVVTDLAMPVRDRYWLLRCLRQLDPWLPVIAFTAFGSHRDAARVRDAGFNEHLSKPVDPSRLIDRLLHEEDHGSGPHSRHPQALNCRSACKSASEVFAPRVRMRP